MRPSNNSPSERDARFRLLALTVIAGFAVIAFGLMRLQITHFERYQELSTDNYVLREILRAPRGAIYDRNGVLLADSAPSFNIVFRPFPAESTHRVVNLRNRDWVEHVAAFTGLDTTELKDRVSFAERSGNTQVLRRNTPFDVRAAVAETREDLPGIEVQVEPLRRYPNGELAAHLLGYAGEINDRELEERSAEGYWRGDLIGRNGVEHSSESILRGRNGTDFVIVNASGRRVATLGERPPAPPQPGHDIVLSIDLEIQRAMEEAMAGVKRGAAVAIDPRDGGVLAMVSRPGFDPNEFSVGLSQKRWTELSRGGQNPLLNRAIQGLYPPASTIKSVTMLGALEEGIVKATDHLPKSCTGSYKFGRRPFRCWKRGGHGSLDFIGALENSCDVYFYQIGLRIGIAKFGEWARAFGLGRPMGIDLPGEKGGLIPDDDWYDRRNRRWKGIMLNLAIGQGELLVTPLQIATLYAELARDGLPIQPHVVREVRGDPRFQVERPTRGRTVARRSSWRAVHEGLERAVSDGTARAARVPGVRVAGKTGTGENPHGEDHAWFVCYAPIENPSIVLAFLIENAGHGGSIAAPRAGHVLRRFFLPDSMQTRFRPPYHAPVARRVVVPDSATVRAVPQARGERVQ